MNETIRDCIEELKSICEHEVSGSALESIYCVLVYLTMLLPDTSPQEQKT